MREILAKWLPVVIVALVVCFLIIFFGKLIADQKKKNRFSKNRLVKRLVDKLTASMLVKIQNAEAPTCEQDKISMEIVRVFKDSFLMTSESIYFRHENLKDLESERERILMAAAIAQQLKQRLSAQLPKVDPINGKPYKLVVAHKWAEIDKVRCATVFVYYIVPNENYVEIQNW